MPLRAPVHRPIGAQSRAERRADYDRARGKSLYDLRRWKRLRAAYLVRNPICECGCGRAATVVDHKTPHRGDLALMFDWSNLQALTKPCHDRKTVAHDGGFGRNSP